MAGHHVNPYGYPQEVWRLFNETPNAGSLDGPGTMGVRVEAAAQQSVLELQVRLDGDRIAESRFRALGCPTTIAVGAWLATTIAGRPVAGLTGLDAAGIRGALGIAEDRSHCALLGEDLIRGLLKRIQ